jgi:hypothetical protein
LAYSYFGLVGPVTVRIAGGIRMLRQLLVSIAVSICNIAIHAIVMANRIVGGAHRERAYNAA